jgi:hypothetical protein
VVAETSTAGELPSNASTPTIAETLPVTVVKNDAVESMSCTITLTAGMANHTLLSCSDLNAAHAVSVVAGDRISLQVADSNTSNTSNYYTVGLATTLVCQ